MLTFSASLAAAVSMELGSVQGDKRKSTGGHLGRKVMKTAETLTEGPADPVLLFFFFLF